MIPSGTPSIEARGLSGGRVFLPSCGGQNLREFVDRCTCGISVNPGQGNLLDPSSFIWAVEAFTEHLNLHDAVELDLGQPLDDDVSIVFIMSEWISAARCPQSLSMAAIWRVVDRACGTDDLVLDAGLGPHAVALLNARLDDVAVASRVCRRVSSRFGSTGRVSS